MKSNPSKYHYGTAVYRLFGLSKGKHRRLEAFFDSLTTLRSHTVFLGQDHYDKTGERLSRLDYYYRLTPFRNADKEAGKWLLVAQRSVVARVADAYKQFSEKKRGRPRKFKRVRSCEVGKPRRCKEKGNQWYITIAEVGRIWFKPTDALMDSEWEVTKARVVRHSLGTGYDIQLTIRKLRTHEVDTRAPIGIDPGVKTTATLSDGTKYPKVDIDDRRQRRLQRRMSRAKKGSRSRAKKRRAYRKECQRIATRRRGILHEYTTDIVKHHSANIALEALRVANLTRKGGRRKRGSNRAMLGNGLGMLAPMLTYKAERAGGGLAMIPAKNTTQTCSHCGVKPEDKIGLSVRTYNCEACGWVQCRDVNAARNSLHRALEDPKVRVAWELALRTGKSTLRDTQRVTAVAQSGDSYSLGTGQERDLSVPSRVRLGI